jgi:hypothetical protein
MGAPVGSNVGSPYDGLSNVPDNNGLVNVVAFHLHLTGTGGMQLFCFRPAGFVPAPTAPAPVDGTLELIKVGTVH